MSSAQGPDSNNLTEEGSCYFIANKMSETDFEPFLYYFITALVVTRVITFLIDWRQLMKYKEATPDPYLADDFNKQEFEDSQKYQYEKHSFKIVHSAFDLFTDLCFWLLFVWVWIWNRVDYIMSSLALCSDTPYINDITQAVLFAACLLLIESVMNLPFSIYDTFVIEENYGFNKTTKGTFIKDEIKKLVLLILLFAVLIPLLLWIIEKTGEAMIPALAGVCIFGIVLINLLIPTVILPIFFTFSELEDEDLRNKIYAEAEKTKINVDEIRVIDGSQRSSHSNAFVAGLCGARKVVVFDTLLEQHSEEEILAVVNHELGHVAH